jgi:general secretion pathway protein J
MTSENKEDGFTLVEILVALAIVSILSATLLTAISQFRHLLRLDARLQHQMNMERVAHHIAELLNRAETIGLASHNQATAVRPPFEGAAGSVSFVTTARRGATTAGLRRIRILIDDLGDGSILLQEMMPVRNGPDSADDPETIGISEKIVSLRFSYFGARSADTPPSWGDDWTDQVRLPPAVLVRITADFNGSEIVAEDIATPGSR